jgi:hypothetical protein
LDITEFSINHLVELESLLEPARDLMTCHGDLWADHLLAAVT